MRRERECLTCCYTAASELRSVMRRERERECLTCCKTAASGLRSIMRRERERVFDLLLNSCVRTQVINEGRESV